jgi:CheY-like chemotaxis protein
MNKNELFKSFMEEHDILIVDKNPSSRNRLSKIVFELGSKRSMIHTASSLEEAQTIIHKKNVGVVLSEYIITGGSGFDLFKLVRDKNPHKRELCHILVTSNISQAAVAKAAEEDVDSFIIKPYTIQGIKENLLSTISQKISPSEYIVIVEEGKLLLTEKKYAEAITTLKEACKLHPKPSLALFYIGQAEYLKNRINEATESYQQGLQFINIHYKCLVGLFELFMRENNHREAYQVVRKISKYFPANPERLSQVVRLAIQTKNFEDMNFYYEIFTSLEERNEELTNYLGAGMYVAGKYFLQKNKPELALELFQNVAVSCSEFTKFLRAIVTILVEHNMGQEAESFLKRFPAGTIDSVDYRVCEFLITSKIKKDQGFILKMGLDLYNQHIRDYQCMKALVQAMVNSGQGQEKINPLLEEISTLYPEK